MADSRLTQCNSTAHSGSQVSRQLSIHTRHSGVGGQRLLCGDSAYLNPLKAGHQLGKL